MHEAGFHGVVRRLEEALCPAGPRIKGSLPQSCKSISSFMILRYCGPALRPSPLSGRTKRGGTFKLKYSLIIICILLISAFVCNTSRNRAHNTDNDISKFINLKISHLVYQMPTEKDYVSKKSVIMKTNAFFPTNKQRTRALLCLCSLTTLISSPMNIEHTLEVDGVE